MISNGLDGDDATLIERCGVAAAPRGKLLMKRILLIGLVAVLASPGPCKRAAVHAGAAGAPKLHLATTEQHLGSVTVDRAEAVFEVKNVGTGDLLLFGPCGTSHWPPGAIAPGQEARLRVHWDVMGRNGEVAETFTLHSNDLTQQSFSVTLGARIELPARLEPAVLDLGAVEPGESVVRRVAVVGPLASQLEVGAVTSPDDMTVTARKLGGEVELTFAIAGDAPRGERRTGRLAIVPLGTNVPADLKLGLDVEALVRPLFVIEPAEWTGYAAPDGSISLPDFWVTATTGSPFDVRSITDSANNVTAEAHPDGAGRVRITTRVKSPVGGRLVQGTLTIVTDPPADPELRQRYTLYATPRSH